MVRYDEVQASLGTSVRGGGYYWVEELSILLMGRRARGFERTKVVGPTERVVRGRQVVPVVIR